MKKIIAAAALCAVSFAVPVLPVQAAPLLTEAQANCLILPVLKKECWERGAERAAVIPRAIAASAKTVADQARSTAKSGKFVYPGNCTRAAAGAGHLFDC